MAKGARPVRFRSKWRIRWFDHDGKRQSAVFERYEDAEKALRARQAEVDDIRDGIKKPKPARRTFSELADLWLETRAKEKRSGADDASIIGAHLRPFFGRLALRDIEADHIDRYKRAKNASATQTIRNHLSLLGTMLRHAVEIGWLITVPPIRKPRIDPDSTIEPAWLKTRDEIDRLLAAARSLVKADDPFSEVPFVTYSCAVYTGLRAGELAGLRWSDIDLDRRTINVRRSYGGKTKTRSSRRFVPIMDALLPVLLAWRDRCPTNDEDLVLPNRAGNMHEACSRLFQEGLHNVLDLAGFSRPTKGRNRHVIHFHSLRHTFACHWRINGGTMDELQRVLGHTSKAMSEHYANIGGYHRPEQFRIFRSSVTDATAKPSAGGAESAVADDASAVNDDASSAAERLRTTTPGTSSRVGAVARRRHDAWRRNRRHKTISNLHASGTFDSESSVSCTEHALMRTKSTD